MLPNSYTSVFDRNSKLRWEGWNGELPRGAVSIYNDYTKRTDYVSKYQRHSGFYTPSKGPYCYYPVADIEKSTSSFDILVNEEDFEKLEWKEGSYGSLPPHSVSCWLDNSVYVGRNKYGLGKVSPQNTCFFLPYEGKETWYKYYEVLTVNMDVTNEVISDVNYNIDQAEKIMGSPKVLEKSTVRNNYSQPLEKTTTLTTKITETRTWDFNFSQMIGAKVTITAGIPKFGDVSIEVSSAETYQYSKGSSVTDEREYSDSIKYTIPPNSCCTAKLVGFTYNMKVPFTACLSRTYRTGETRSTTISGTYQGLQSGEIEIRVDEC